MEVEGIIIDITYVVRAEAFVVVVDGATVADVAVAVALVGVALAGVVIMVGSIIVVSDVDVEVEVELREAGLVGDGGCKAAARKELPCRDWSLFRVGCIIQRLC